MTFPLSVLVFFINDEKIFRRTNNFSPLIHHNYHSSSGNTNRRVPLLPLMSMSL